MPQDIVLDNFISYSYTWMNKEMKFWNINVHWNSSMMLYNLLENQKQQLLLMYFDKIVHAMYGIYTIEGAATDFRMHSCS